MPVYLVFLQVAKRGLQLALCAPNLPALLEACNFRQGNEEIFFSYVSYCLSVH